MVRPTPPYIPDRGDFIKINFSPQAGHEQADWRPALVLTPSEYNRRAGLAVVCPITNQVKGYPFEVEIPRKLPISGAILADHLKSLDWQARKAKAVGKCPTETLEEVQGKLRALLDL